MKGAWRALAVAQAAAACEKTPRIPGEAKPQMPKAQA
jgi:hypothetical protein